MRFTLKQDQKVKTKFRVFNENGDTVGSICCEENEIPDLLRHWHGAVQAAPAQAQAQPRQVQPNPMIKAMLKHKRGLSPVAILRSC